MNKLGGVGEGGGMAAENKCGTTVHCQIHLNELKTMAYKLSKFNSVAHGTRFVGRTKAEFLR